MRSALADLLADPGRVLTEARRLQNSKAPTRELAAVSKALESVEGRQRRLVKLFTEGDLPAELLNEQRTALSREPHELEERRQRLEAQQGATINLSVIDGRMQSVLAAIREWQPGRLDPSMGLGSSEPSQHPDRRMGHGVYAQDLGRQPAAENSTTRFLIT
jgi:hypothetical protein